LVVLEPMVDPLTALLVALALVAGGVVLLRPRRGLLWRLLRALHRDQRELVEDALKHLYDCEYRGEPGSPSSLAGALELGGHRAAALVERLVQLGLVVPRDAALQLTAEGRSYALRVIRIHRLWERYLSDATDLDPRDLHEVACQREHATSDDEAEALAARMFYPRYDPHGDPIPTAAGEMPPPRGQPLSTLPADQPAEIVHIEDEPPQVYAQLVAQGLQLGMQVRVFESSPTRLRFEANGEEQVLAPVTAANVSVVPLDAPQPTSAGPGERLSALRPGDSARVVALSDSCHGLQRRRLLDLGLVPGTLVAAEMTSPGGDPTAYRIRGALIALRQEQADLIEIERQRQQEATP
jgi:DtxR family Mn-dependent transcriptional regulator